jgi:osmotically-inducible protein OsmY
MKRHVTVAAFVLALTTYSLGQTGYRDSQDSQNRVDTTQHDEKLSKKDRKKLEKEQKKEEKKEEKNARKQDREQDKHQQKKEAEEQRKQYKDEEKRAAEERKRELKEQQKQVASEQKSERKNDEKYERKEAERAQKEQAREMNRHIEHEARAERASAAHAPTPRYVHVPRIPVLATATQGLLAAQREVSHAIYSQLPSSDVRVLLDSGNQIVLRGSAPSPSWRQRLLQLAMGAARGYSVVDQLAANFVGEAAGAATSAAIGGVSDLIHGSGVRDRGNENASGPPPDSSAQAPPYPQQAPAYSQQASSYPQPPSPYPQQALPNSDSETVVSALDPGSNACVNLADADRVLLTGQVASQPSAELIRRFAQQLVSPSALVVDQLAVRTAGIPSTGNAQQDVATTSGASTPAPGTTVAGSSAAGSAASANSPAPTVSTGSTVCVTENKGEVFLTGTVGSTTDLGTVESAVQPLVGGGRLLDQLTIASMNPGSQAAASAPVANAGPSQPTQQSEVEQALHSIPRLSNVNVQVAADGVHLSGSVDTPQDDQMASDVARQYAPGRPVVDNVTVARASQPLQR